MTDSYRAFLRMMCHFWAPGQDEYLAGEIIQQWSIRQGYRREMATLQAEIMKREAVLGDLLHRKKQQLCKLGRNGRWSAWLEQSKIPRSTADRLVIDHAEFFGLKEELNHRSESDPHDGTISQAARRTTDRLGHTLRSPRSRLTFLKCLGDLLGLEVENGGDESVKMSFTVLPGETSEVVPPIIEMQEDGSVRPINYELRDDGEESVL
ncbi:hypothetical protein [Occallatibacter savannae]|uniref:hypothetical protein n=1 Tax=Occallatibacter savannae TaxID=1002691 RepID=UPI0013A5751A|nr:hypothetical protein [Occallatibacter savannae]